MSGKNNGNGYSHYFTRRCGRYIRKQTMVDNIVFASKKEAQYYVDLKEKFVRGEVINFDMQVEYELQPAYVNANGKKIRPIKYVADFVYTDKLGFEHIVDVKGIETDVFKIKKKLFEYRYKDKILEVYK